MPRCVPVPVPAATRLGLPTPWFLILADKGAPALIGRCTFPPVPLETDAA